MEDVSHQRNRRRCVGADAPTCSDFFSPRLARVRPSASSTEKADRRPRARGAAGSRRRLPGGPAPGRSRGPARTDGAGRRHGASPPGQRGQEPSHETRTSVRQGLGQRLPRPGGRRHFLRPEAPSAHPGVAPAALVSLSLSLPRANRGWRRPHSPCQGETAAATGERRESTNLHGHAPDARPCWRREAGSAD